MFLVLINDVPHVSYFTNYKEYRRYYQYIVRQPNHHGGGTLNKMMLGTKIVPKHSCILQVLLHWILDDGKFHEGLHFNLTDQLYFD